MSEQLTALYHAVNGLMARIGQHGHAGSRDPETSAVMDALAAIDGGQYKPDLSLAALGQGEAVEYQRRLVHIESGEDHTGWYKCSRKDYENNNPAHDESSFRTEYRALYTHAPQPVVPEGFVMVPERMYVQADAWEAATFNFGGPATGEGEPYMDCTLWVGSIDNDDGGKTYGLHVSCDECPEEGSITLAEFAAAQSPEAQPSRKSWSLHDRVEFALRDSGFDLDEASRIAALVEAQPQGEGMAFADADALANWLETLCECGSDGAVGASKWEPAQRAAAAIRNQAAGWTKDAEEWGRALNEAAWEFVEHCPETSALLFNNTKAPLRAAILKYADAIATHTQEGRG